MLAWFEDGRVTLMQEALYPQRHLLASLVIAALSLLFNQKVPFLTVELFGYDFTVFLLCVVFGVLIDVDHVVDYRLNRWHMSESLESRFKKGRMFVVFHGIENIVILAALSIVFPFLIFPAARYFCHMAMDIYSNEVPF
jgi:hypothetical protein